jgi:two-component system, chemotaxis family, sensor kinase CheA
MDFQAELLNDYVCTSNDCLDNCDRLLLKLESLGDCGDTTPEIQELLSLLHTFKGNSGMMGFEQIPTYIHKLEDILKAVIAGEVQMTSDICDIMLTAALVLREAISSISADNINEPDLSADLDAIDAFMEIIRQAGPAEDSDRAETGQELEAFDLAIQSTSTLKVEFSRLDDLMNLMGELVIHRTRLSRVEMQLKSKLGMSGTGRDFRDALEQLTKVSAELHESIMRVRMLPIKHVFVRFPRYVRDFAKKTGKDVELIFE